MCKCFVTAMRHLLAWQVENISSLHLFNERQVAILRLWSPYQKESRQGPCGFHTITASQLLAPPVCLCQAVTTLLWFLLIISSTTPMLIADCSGPSPICFTERAGQLKDQTDLRTKTCLPAAAPDFLFFPPGSGCAVACGGGGSSSSGTILTTAMRSSQSGGAAPSSWYLIALSWKGRSLSG
jgi:hypothetical protein